MLKMGTGKAEIPKDFALPIYAGAKIEGFLPQKIRNREWDTAAISTHDSADLVITDYIRRMTDAHWTIEKQVNENGRRYIVGKLNKVSGTVIVQDVNGRTKITLLTVK